MSIAIHHGPPGSYKTFSIVQRHALEALKAGRTIVTNIRGFDSMDKVKAAFPEIDFPDDAQILGLSLKDPDCIELIRRWWHWVPFGALVLIDEAQMVYPQRREFRLKSLDTIEPRLIQSLGLDIETTFNGEQRPATMEIAFDMHRHFNWDLFLSTPNIGKINKEIRQSTEWAYRHRDLSTLLPWLKGKWVEVQHDAEFTGKSLSHVTGSPTRYKADPRIWQCYQSTATGQHNDSVAGRSIFKDPKILGLSVVVLVCIAVFVSTVGNMSMVKAADSSKHSPGQVSHQGGTVSPGYLSGRSDDHAHVAQIDGIESRPRARSVSELSARGAVLSVLAKIDRHGFTDEDLDQIPDDCEVNPSRIRCPVKTEQRPYFNNTYCLANLCYAIFTPKPVEPTPVQPVLKDVQSVV